VGLAESRIGLAENRLLTFAWQMSQCKLVSTR